MTILSIALRLIAAGILAQTLFFKFSGAPESRWIFTQLGVEPWGRWFAGATELVAAILLLIPRTKTVGALAAVGTMGGAILSHLAVLGVVVQDDGGLLFGLAWTVLITSVAVIALHRNELRHWIKSVTQMVFKGRG